MGRMRRGCGLCLAAALACGEPGPEDWPPGRPLIEEVLFLGPSPFVSEALAFALRFRDDDGDLGSGETVLFIADQRVSTQANQDLFMEQQPPLQQDAQAGWLELLVRLDERPQAGQRLSFGFELVDASGEASNRSAVTLRVVGGGD